MPSGREPATADDSPPEPAPALVPDVTPDPPGAAWRAVLALLGRLPQASLSRGMGALADVPLPRRLRRPVLRAFAKAFGIDRSEAARPLEEYGSLNDFFVRRLKAGARDWPDAPGLASPVDGVVGQWGRVSAGRIVQAKGRTYAAADLLGGEEEAARYRDGWFVTLYLSPRHYHRIHAPVGGTVRWARYVPGELFPVHGPAVRQVEDLFARNERLVCEIGSAPGRVALVAVGAYNVGRISAAFDPAWSGPGERGWVTNRKDEELPRERRYDPPISLERGDDLMAFHLGSTVVLLAEPGGYEPAPALRSGAEVRLGTLLASALPPDPSTTPTPEKP